MIVPAKKINELIGQIDGIAREYDDEYGLPVYNKIEMKKIRMAIRHWLIEVDGQCVEEIQTH